MVTQAEIIGRPRHVAERLGRSRRVARALAGAPRRLVTWWTALAAAERVLYRAVVLLGAGFGLVYPPLALIVPGLLFALAFFDFRFRGHA